MSNNDFKIGDLVKWYTTYADDLDLVKDAGPGILLCIRKKSYGRAYEIFDVYRFKNNDIISVTARDIEHLKEK